MTRLLLHYVLVVCAIVCLFCMICYYNYVGSDIVIHDNGCECVMRIYSQTGDLLETHAGFIGILRMNGDTVVCDCDGGCITVQGAIVMMQGAE